MNNNTVMIYICTCISSHDSDTSHRSV